MSVDGVDCVIGLAVVLDVPPLPVDGVEMSTNVGAKVTA